MLARRLALRQAVQALDQVPQRVAVQHEARPRHDVGPVARLVLLQQEEALMFLRVEPLHGERDLAPIALEQSAAAAAAL
ncbi:hypothetical protein D3C83_182570 [compost metagenome]